MLSGTASARSFGRLWHGLWAAVGHRVGVGVGRGHTAEAGQRLLGEVGKGQEGVGKRLGRGWERKAGIVSVPALRFAFVTYG